MYTVAKDELDIPSSRSSDGILVLAAITVAARFCIQAIKFRLARGGFCDFANLYLYSRLLSQGTDAYSLSGDELLKAQATMPVHVCGPAGYSPLLFDFARLFYSRDYFVSLDRWLIFSLLLAGLSIPLVIYGFGVQPGARAIAVPVLVLFLFPYLLEAFALGQTSMIVHAALAAYFYFLQQNRSWPAALAGTAVVAIKINFLPVLAIPVAIRNWRTTLATAACCGGSLLIVIAAHGTAIVRSFIGSALRLGVQARPSFDSMNPSLQHTVHSLFPMFPASVANAIVFGIAGIVVLITVAALWNPGWLDTAIVFAAIVTGTLAITPFLEIHYLLFIFIPILAVFWRIGDRLRTGESALFAFSFVVLAVPFGTEGFPAFHQGILVLIANSKLIALFVLWGLLVKHVADGALPHHSFPPKG